FIMFRSRHRLEKLFAGISDTHRNLDSLAELLRRIEAEKFNAPLLQRLQAGLITQGMAPSACIARLDTLADLDDSRHNWFVHLFDVPLLYSLQLLLPWRTGGASIDVGSKHGSASWESSRLSHRWQRTRMSILKIHSRKLFLMAR